MAPTALDLAVGVTATSIRMSAVAYFSMQQKRPQLFENSNTPRMNHASLAVVATYQTADFTHDLFANAPGAAPIIEDTAFQRQKLARPTPK